MAMVIQNTKQTYNIIKKVTFISWEKFPVHQMEYSLDLRMQTCVYSKLW